MEPINRPDLTLHVEFPVKQLTSQGSVNLCQYFTHTSWLPDSKTLVFVSDQDHPGSLDLYGYHISTGKISAITEKAHISPYSWAISPSGVFIVYFGGENRNEFRKVTLSTLEDTLICLRPAQYDGWDSGIMDIHPDNDHFYICSHEPGLRVPSNLFCGSISEQRYTAVLPKEVESNYFIDHQMLNPTNPNQMQINFTPKERFGKEAKQRMWLLDLTTNQFRPLYKQKKGFFSRFERVGHEAWCPDGKHLTFIVRRNKIRICDLNPSFGQEQNWTAGKGPNFWHGVCSPKGNILVADTQWADTGIWLIEYRENQEGRLFNLCKAESQWEDDAFGVIEKQIGFSFQAHPHPGWSPDGKYIQFTAYHPDLHGVHLFLVDVSNFSFESSITKLKH